MHSFYLKFRHCQYLIQKLICKYIDDKLVCFDGLNWFFKKNILQIK